MAASNQCEPLTRTLQWALQAHGYNSRREFHKVETGQWHYLIAHTAVGEPPVENDIITDLNPWQFQDEISVMKSCLHLPGEEVQSVLRTEQAPEWFISLRGLDTIVQAHKLP